jgi:uncharacterized lipoprotein YehR (DUF1307 family)
MEERKEINKMCDVPDDILKQLQKDVSDIKTALLGNQYNESGLIKRQCENELKLKSLKSKQEEDSNKINNRIDRIYWTAGGISFGVSFIIGVILFIINFIKG